MKSLIVLLLFAQEIQGGFNYLKRSPQAMLMGDAFTAVANDEFTLFYNPAALGRHHGFSVSPLFTGVAVTNILKDKDRFDDFPSDPVDIANRVLGQPAFFEGQLSSSFKFHHYAMNIFLSSGFDIALHNNTYPNFNIEYRYDRGFVFGGAFVLGDDFKSKERGFQTSLGVGVKRIVREGLDGRFDLFGTELLEIIDDTDSYRELKEELGHSKGDGWGFDLGVEGHFFWGNTNLNIGFAVMDVGDTRFKKTRGRTDVPSQEMMMAFGMALEEDFGFFDYTFFSRHSPHGKGHGFWKQGPFGVAFGPSPDGFDARLECRLFILWCFRQLFHL